MLTLSLNDLYRTPTGPQRIVHVEFVNLTFVQRYTISAENLQYQSKASLHGYMSTTQFADEYIFLLTLRFTE